MTKRSFEYCWWKEIVVYQIYPRSFLDTNGDGIGDLGGIIARIPYLRELGIDMVWLCPIYATPNDDNGYDVSDYYSINSEFGTMEDFDRLVKTLNEHGIRLMMDLVVNHTSSEHYWFQESQRSKNNPYRDYYIWLDGKNNGPPNNWRGFFNESAWTLDPNTDQYYLHLYSKRMPDLNWACRPLREEIYALMSWWRDKGVDGFRLDTINTIAKDPSFPDAPVSDPEYVRGRRYFTNLPMMHEVLREMNERIFSPWDMVTVGECSSANISDTLLMVSSDRCELSMNHMFEHDELDWGPRGAWDIVSFMPSQLYDVITRWQTQLPAGKGWNSWFWSNHDVPRAVSRFGSEQWRERSAKLLALIQMTLQATPFIYQGDEIGMTNYPFSIEEFVDIDSLNYITYAKKRKLSMDRILNDLRYRSRDNARTPMQWDDSLFAGFSISKPWLAVNPNKSCINVQQEKSDVYSVLHFYRKAINLRRNNKILIYGDFHRLDNATNNSPFIYERRLECQRAVVIVNASDEMLPFSLQEESGLISGLCLALCNIEKMGDNILQPWEARLYLPKKANNRAS